MTKHFSYFMSASLIGGATVALLACSTATASSSAVAPAPVKAHEAAAATKTPPAKVFDLSHWNITLPMDKNRDGKVCLLYTSPSPRDQRGSRMPSSA